VSYIHYDVFKKEKKSCGTKKKDVPSPVKLSRAKLQIEHV